MRVPVDSQLSVTCTACGVGTWQGVSAADSTVPAGKQLLASLHMARPVHRAGLRLT